MCVVSYVFCKTIPATTLQKLETNVPVLTEKYLLLYFSSFCFYSHFQRDTATACAHTSFCVCRDIVKLTAQFVARNGAQFLDKLMVREQRNYQFDFLRKQHPLFTYFTKLVEQYSKILMPPHARLHQLRREIENPYLVAFTSLSLSPLFLIPSLPPSLPPFLSTFACPIALLSFFLFILALSLFLFYSSLPPSVPPSLLSPVRSMLGVGSSSTEVRVDPVPG